MQSTSTSLPKPEEEALAHSNQVQAHIAKIISQQGSVPFSRFMQEALYAPGLGYYAAGLQKFGIEGDFITAPEISSLFAKCIATQAAQVLKACNGDLLELGGGSGVLAADLIESLIQQDCEPNYYYILEPSADLQLRQKSLLSARLPDWRGRIKWLDKLPQRFTGLIVANEVMDAFPVEKFIIVQQEVQQLTVVNKEDSFAFKAADPTPELSNFIHEIKDYCGHGFAEGYQSEVNLNLKPWIKALAETLKTGAIVLLDYGYPRTEYYLPERDQGTLRCYYRHRMHDNPFLYPGLQDITSHVDFSALVSAAIDADLELQGFTTQAQFLLATGLLEHAQRLGKTAIIERSKLSREIQRLTLPAAMGESFSVIGFSRGMDDVLQGFTGQDLTHRL